MNDEINNIFDNIKELVISSRNRVYTTVNTEMLNLYWNIGKAIMEIKHLELLKVDEESKRKFYMKETINSRWSVR